MSSTSRTASASSKFEAILNAALTNYAKQTGHDLRNHPFASRIDKCDSAESILDIFREQAKKFDDFRNGDPKLIRGLHSFVSDLYVLSTNPTLSTAITLAFPPASPIFSGISILLSIFKSVKENYDALVDIFECIDGFVMRLMIYTKIEQPTHAMTEVVVKIMAELISILALATRQMKQRKLKKYAKTLLGDNQIKSVLQRLDRLTGEESKITVAQTLDVVCGLVNNMEVVMEGGKASTSDIQEALALMHEITMKVNKIERDRLHERFRSWLPSPDPWSNHNIAREARHPDTATWFVRGEMFGQWKSAGSLLWVNGLPGSGKTIISSSIIEDLQDLCRRGLATLSIFYCDFRDTNKQNPRNLLSSVLIQLCQQSDAFSEILSSVYSTHGDGSQEPSIEVLLGCLKTMLQLPGQGTLYLVLDALDECPNSSGLPTQREQVLKILKELIELKLPHLRFCVASRPEVDIREVLGSLDPESVSLHDQDGQKKDLARYVESVVLTDATMMKWPEKVKKSVIDTLTNKGGGMFRWAFCQLETLRRCPLRNISRALEGLPKTLDDTYERILQGIPEEKREDAHRIFQWLTASLRPLRVEELAEVFAIDFDAGPSGIPNFNPNWRSPDAEADVLSTCSTLIAVVDIRGEQVVQFAHFSVKVYLTSERMTNLAPVSHFQVLLKPAHTLLAKACLSVLLQLDDNIDETKVKNFPLASYAAEHWVDHARFEDVSSHIGDVVDGLFDRNKSHLAAWIWLHDIDLRIRHSVHPKPTQPSAVPLYYAALCGLPDLAERLLNAHPQDLNARGGYHETPLHAAVDKGHLDIVLLLLGGGADVNSRGRLRQTALYMASSRGFAKIAQLLIDRSADPNAVCDDKDDENWNVAWTALHVASKNGRLEIARMILVRGADVNFRDNNGRSPLHIASRRRSNDFARLLLDHGADPNAPDKWGKTGLYYASSEGNRAVLTLLLERGANVNAKSNDGWTLLHYAAKLGHPEVVQLLLDHGADVNATNEYCWTALHMAASNGHLQVVEVLLKRGADPRARTKWEETPFELAWSWNRGQVAQLLSTRTGEKM